jgi:hypothetical protein
MLALVTCALAGFVVSNLSAVALLVIRERRRRKQTNL